jgi:hypothetical protein
MIYPHFGGNEPVAELVTIPRLPPVPDFWRIQLRRPGRDPFLPVMRTLVQLFGRNAWAIEYSGKQASLF